MFSREPWIEWPEIEKRLDACDDLYFDAVSQISLPRWSLGRSVLVGDAAYCPSLLAGEGAAFGMAGAYILACELERTVGDHTRAFAAFEQHFRPFIERKQKAARAFARSFAQDLARPVRTRSSLTTRRDPGCCRFSDAPFCGGPFCPAGLTAGALANDVSRYARGPRSDIQSRPPAPT